MFTGRTRYIKTLNGLKFSLETGSYVHKHLQEDWKRFGKDAFDIPVLEVLKEKEDPYLKERKPWQSWKRSGMNISSLMAKKDITPRQINKGEVSLSLIYSSSSSFQVWTLSVSSMPSVASPISVSVSSRSRTLNLISSASASESPALSSM